MENLRTPLSRVELYLAKACGMDVTVPEQPLSRLEQFLAILAGDTSITMPAPMSLTEQWLAYVLGVTPDPLLAVEGACLIGAQKVDVRYFAVAASMPGATLPEAPQNRAEMYWAHIAGNPPTPGILKYVTGKYFYLTDVVSGIEELQYVKGDTYQQTYSGANIYNYRDTAAVSPQGVSVDDDGWITFTSDNTGGSSTLYVNYFSSPLQVVASTSYNVMLEIKSVNGTSGAKLYLTSYHSASQFREDSEITLSEIQPGITKYILTTALNISSCTVGLRTFLRCSAGNSGTVTFRLSVLKDTSITPEDFVYQPFTGNIPAPNPDYPQPIQVVTGEQTVNISDDVTSRNYEINLTGKNLFDDTQSFQNGYLNATTGEFNPEYQSFVSNQYIEVTGGSTITYSSNIAMRYHTIYSYDSNKTYLKREVNQYNSQSTKLTLDANAKYIRVGGSKDSSTTITASVIQDLDIQIEEGSATAYAPYYNYELCKIGDYQDFIYKSGDDWYVHKAIDTQVVDTSNITARTTYSNLDYAVYPKSATSIFYGNYIEMEYPLLCTHATHFATGNFNTTNNIGGVFMSPNTTNWWLGFAKNTSLDTMKSDLSGCKLYSPLATPTDTKITDATLISQLNALNSAPLPKPIASIALGATGTNLTPYLTIAYYGSDEE